MPEDSHAMAEQRALPGRRPKRLLVAEDNVVNQKVSVVMLEKIGYEVDVVSNGRKAVDAVAGHRYAAVLMDCHMPEMDGYQATSEIRRREEQTGSPRLPIIAMTAAAMEGEKAKCLAAGMDDYIAKPVKIEELASTVTRWVNGGRKDEAVAAPMAQRVQTAHVEPDGNSTHLDPAKVAELREVGDESGRDGFSVLAEIFLNDAPPRLTAIRDAVEENDPEKAAFEAHALRGSAANLGAVELARMCEELEELGISGRLDGAAELYARLESEFSFVVEEFGAICR